VVVVVETCGREVVTPETGSALEAGQNPPLGFFFEDQWPESPFVTELGGGGVGGGCCCCCCCCEEEEMVELDEVVEDIEDDEFVLCTLFRCGMNIRDTSSALIEFRFPAPLLLFQPSLDSG
jgi:hypothetical protein